MCVKFVLNRQEYDKTDATRLCMASVMGGLIVAVWTKPPPMDKTSVMGGLIVAIQTKTPIMDKTSHRTKPTRTKKPVQNPLTLAEKWKKKFFYTFIMLILFVAIMFNEMKYKYICLIHQLAQCKFSWMIKGSNSFQLSLSSFLKELSVG